MTSICENLKKGRDMSEYDIQNVEIILDGHGTWFTARLLRLIANADRRNRAKLACVFSKEVALVEACLICQMT